MLQRNLLLPPAGRSKYIASDPEGHNLDVQCCQILKLHTLPSSTTDCKTQKTCWDLTVYSGVPRNVLGRRWGSYARNFFWGEGGQQIQLRTKGREKGDLGAVVP
jgi:hypothetical protein